MKKSTKAATKKTAAKAVKKAAPAPAAPVETKVAATKVAATKVAAKKAATKTVKATAPKPAAAPSHQPKTTIVAKVDVGFGNSLFLRGDAPGLSWSKGVPMDCGSDSEWSISIAGVTEPFEFKLLINDSYWNAGYNLTAKPGDTVEINPEF